MKRFVILAAVFTAFATAVIAQGGPIGGRQWKLVRLNGVTVGPSSTAYLELNREQTRLTGNAGCNRMFGSVEIRRDRIDVSNIGTTRMACADRRIQRLESDFVRTLENVDRFERRGNSLELFVRRRMVAKFLAPVRHNPEEPTDVVRLEDKKWTLEAIGGVAVPKAGRGAFIVFDREKRSAGGDSSCNVFGGSYSASGGRLAITDVVSTMRACVEDERMEIERGFLDGLRSTNRYEIRDGKLMLYRDKRLLLTFKGEAK